uniref:Probable receptor-like protein kinase At5g15080 n=1 Tax=Nicotiana tabacum TaxID=4097 RepID=A0A1S3YJP0_TOBAC|nr:PREDICTED: probable receptor-like protein kinase At5g15080 [Nicotiana tabacum]
MIDKDLNIKVFDFGFLTHISDLEDERVYYPLSPDAPEIVRGIRTSKSDVYTFGLLLMELIFQKENMCKPRHRIELDGVDDVRSLLDKSVLQVDYEQAHCITEIVAACLEHDPNARPAMKDVFATLSDLGQESNFVSLLRGFICLNSCFI